MKPKTYRWLTRAIFLFLFLMFFLLYLLLRGGDHRVPGTRGNGWAELSREMGTIRLSEVRSGGFVVDELPFPQSITPGGANFDKNVVHCRAELYNEGAETVNVTIRVHGTDQKEDPEENRGLCGGVYYHPGGENPVAPDYAAFLSAPGITAYPPEKKNMTLYLDEEKYPMVVALNPGETMSLELFFWVDEGAVPQLTQLDTERYSVTVKLISRAP